MPASRNPWRFVIVVACASSLFFCPSFNFSQGVLLVALTDTGLYDVNTVTWLLSFTNMMHALGGPVGSVLISLTSCRTAVIVSGLAGFLGPTLSSCTSDIRIIFVTYGLLLGLARGVIFSTAVVDIGYWFKEDSSMAAGLTYTGAGLGMLVHPRLLQALVDRYNVDGALLMMGAISFHTCICGLLLRPSDFEKDRKRTMKETKHKRKEDTFRKHLSSAFLKFKTVILTNYSFLLFVLGVTLMMTAFSIIITFLPHYLNLQGSTPQEAALAASILGSGSLVSRVLAGFMTNDANIGTVILFEGNCGISAIFTLLLPLMSDSAVGRYIYAFSIGTYLTCLFVIFGPTTLQKVGLSNLAYGFGFLLFCIGIVNLIAPPIGVQVKRLTDSYDAVFIFAGCILFGACLCGFLSEMLKKPDGEEDNNTVDKVLFPKRLIIEDDNSNDETTMPDSALPVTEDTFYVDGEEMAKVHMLSPTPVNDSSDDTPYCYRETNV